jgi:hypothetical protein
MAKYKQRSVGKPSLSRVTGDGKQRTCNMAEDGQVYTLSSNVGRDSISREYGQSKPHMKVKTDPGTNSGGLN